MKGEQEGKSKEDKVDEKKSETENKKEGKDYGRKTGENLPLFGSVKEASFLAFILTSKLRKRV